MLSDFKYKKSWYLYSWPFFILTIVEYALKTTPISEIFRTRMYVSLIYLKKFSLNMQYRKKVMILLLYNKAYDYAY